MRKIIVLGLLLISILVLSGCSLTGSSIFKNCNNIQVPYETQETYTDSEPYTDKECNNEKLKYVINWGTGKNTCLQEECTQYEQKCSEYGLECSSYTQVCVDKNFWGNCVKFEEQCSNYKQVCEKKVTNCIKNKCVKYKRTCELIIKNIDDTSGTWMADTYWVDENKEEHKVGKKSLFVQPTEAKSLLWDYIYSVGSTTNCKYKSVIVPTKLVCKNVIKYRDVTKYRTVTKYKQEEVCS